MSSKAATTRGSGFRRVFRRAARFGTTLVLSVLVVASTPSPVGAHGGGSFSEDAGQSRPHPNWMASLPDSLRLSELSIPGTHDTMARVGGRIAKTQAMPLDEQLKAGIRALDIRLKRINVDGREALYVVHGPVPEVLDIDFGENVMAVANAFLADHPGETLLMGVQDSDTNSDPAEKAADTAAFNDLFEQYMAVYGQTAWPQMGVPRSGAAGWDSNPTNPTLGEVRGKIVFIPNLFTAKAADGHPLGIPWKVPENFTEQPDFNGHPSYTLCKPEELADKWIKIRNFFEDNDAPAPPTTIAYNNLNANTAATCGLAIGDVDPRFVASGLEPNPSDRPASTGTFVDCTRSLVVNASGWNACPTFFHLDTDTVACKLFGRCLIRYEGMNALSLRYLRQGNVTHRTGIVAMDFPASGLIEEIIAINQKPVTADAGGPYETYEGLDVLLDASGSSDSGGGSLTYEWDFDDDGNYDDATGIRPTFDLVGQDGDFPVALKVTSPDGSFDIDGTTVTVHNVAPTVSLAAVPPRAEAGAVALGAVIRDSGWLDPLTATIYWGDGTTAEGVTGVLENVRPNATLVLAVQHVYGDNGIFTVQICASDDDTSTCQQIDQEITNLDPTAEIDHTDAVLVNGVPTIVARAGSPVDFSGRSRDPGSDDLTLRWAWDDAGPDTVTTYLVDPPLADPFPSPSVQPRDVTDDVSHTFAQACMYLVGFSALDDDGGLSPIHTIDVLIVGTAGERRSAGYWQHQVALKGKTDFSAARLECLLEVAARVSTVFNEEVDASTTENARVVLGPPGGSSDMRKKLDRQLLSALLNFANGSIEWDEPVDTDRDGTADTPFHAAVAAAEAVRVDPGSTKQELEAQKDVLERINVEPQGRPAPSKALSRGRGR